MSWNRQVKSVVMDGQVVTAQAFCLEFIECQTLTNPDAAAKF
jgi:hypothetical protein